MAIAVRRHSRTGAGDSRSAGLDTACTAERSAIEQTFVRRHRLTALRLRDFRLFFVGQTASQLGSSFTAVALAFAVLEATGSVADVGLVLAARQFPMTLFVLAGGVIGDRLPRRQVMLASDLVRFATQGAAAILLIAHHARLWQLVALFALNGAAQAFFNPAGVGLVTELVPTDVLQEANALMDAARNGSSMIGQLAAGVLVAAVGAGGAFALDSMSFIVSAAALALVAIPGTLHTRPGGAFARQLREGWHEFRSRTWLWVGTLHVGLLNAFGLVAFFTLGPVVAQRSLGGAAVWGLIGASFAAGLVTGSAVAVHWRPRRPLVTAFSAVFFAAPQLALLALAAPVPAIAAASFFGGGQASLQAAIWMTAMQSDVPTTAISRVASYGLVGSLVLTPLAFALVGYVAAVFGISTVLWAGAAWIIASTAIVVTLPSIRSFRPAPPTLTPGLSLIG